jgi:hypothetical protein
MLPNNQVAIGGSSQRKKMLLNKVRAMKFLSTLKNREDKE